MKKLPLMLGIFMMASCYAFQVVDQELYIQKAESELTEKSLKLQETLDARLPAESKAQPGPVTKQKLAFVNFSNPIFIIGDDHLSRQWLKDHAKELEKIKAIGFITNINDRNHLKEFQGLTKAPLLPANVDDLLDLFHESHYPLMLVGGEIWQ